MAYTVKTYEDAKKIAEKLNVNNHYQDNLKGAIRFADDPSTSPDDIARFQEQAIKYANLQAKNFSSAYQDDLAKINNEAANIANQTDYSGLSPEQVAKEKSIFDASGRQTSFDKMVADFNKNYGGDVAGLFGFSSYQTPNLQKSANGYIEQVGANGQPVSAAVGGQPLNGNLSGAPANMGNTGEGLNIKQNATGGYDIVGTSGKVYGSYGTVQEALANQTKIQTGAAPTLTGQPTVFGTTPGANQEVKPVLDPRTGQMVNPTVATPEQLANAGTANAIPYSDLTITPPDTVDSETLTDIFSSPTTTGDIQKLIEEQTKLQGAYIQSMAPTQAEQSLENSLVDLRRQIDQKVQSAQAGIDKVTGQPIAMEFITGQAKSIAQQADRELNTLKGIESNLVDRLGIEQRNREIAAEQVKTAMDFALQNIELSFEMQDRIEAQQDRVFERSQALKGESRQNLMMMLEMFQGTDLEDMDATSQATLADLAAKSGVPFDLVSQGLTSVKNQLIYEQMKEQTANQLGVEKETWDRVMNLTNSVRQDPDIKDFIALRDGYERLATGAGLDSAAGDIALIYGFMKMQDPTSVVREGEYATAQNAGGVSDVIRNLYNRAKDGTRLTPEQRADFLQTGAKIYDDKKVQYDRAIDLYTNQAVLGGFDPSLVFRDLSTTAGGQDDPLGLGFKGVVADTNSGAGTSQVTQSRFKAGTRGGQCGAFVNDVLGTRLGDSYQNKMSFVDPSIRVPKPGDAFVMPYSWTGHTGLVEGVTPRPDGTFDVHVVDSNWKLDEKIQHHTINSTSISGYIRKSLVPNSRTKTYG